MCGSPLSRLRPHDVETDQPSCCPTPFFTGPNAVSCGEQLALQCLGCCHSYPPRRHGTQQRTGTRTAVLSSRGRGSFLLSPWPGCLRALDSAMRLSGPAVGCILLLCARHAHFADKQVTKRYRCMSRVSVRSTVLARSSPLSCGRISGSRPFSCIFLLPDHVSFLTIPEELVPMPAAKSTCGGAQLVSSTR